MIEPADPEILPPSRPVPEAPQDLAAEDRPEIGFTIHLERVFHGPLDLLLQLVREKELEIHVVALTEVCDAYCRHVRSLDSVDVDEAADYLVIAATLLAIKSRSLLPQEEIEAEEDLFDPGEELVQQLLAYKELRRVTDELNARRDARARLLQAGSRWLGRFDAAGESEAPAAEPEFDLGDVSVWDLFRVIAHLESETGFLRPHRVRQMGRPLRAYVEELWLRLQDVPATTWRALMQDLRAHRGDAAYTLVALLELAKQQQVDLQQDAPFSDVHVRRIDGARALALEELDGAFDQPEPGIEDEVEELLGDDLP